MTNQSGRVKNARAGCLLPKTMTTEAKTKHTYCDFCNSEEGKPRPIGGYIVELRPIEVQGVAKWACQSCHRKTKSTIDKENQKRGKAMKFIQKLKNISFMLFGIVIMLALFSTIAYAQSTPGLPPFPGSPDPAPIDGGLGLLAAAGGAYAIKKLRDKSKE